MIHRLTFGFVGLLVCVSACSGSTQGASTTTTATTTTTTTTSSTAPAGGASAEPSPAPTASAEPAASGSPAPTASASPAPIDLPPMPTNLHGPTTPWARMSARQRSQYMEHDVLPAMRSLLQAYDATRYATVNCATCHGENARAVHFRMPNSLPALAAFGSEAGNRARAEHPRVFAFMAQRFSPAMAQVLGVPPFSPENHQGFGCFNCHAHAQ